MKCALDIRWRRSQVEAALWRYTATQRHWGHDRDGLVPRIPKAFRRRLKKLLDLDRVPGLVPWFDNDQELRAFFDAPKTDHTRRDDLFSSGQAFLLGIGLDLINDGIKQPEAVFFLRHTRDTLLAAYDQIHSRPGARAPVSGGDRQLRLFEDGEAAEPIWLRSRRTAYSDATTWMIVRRREDREAYPLFVKATKGKKVPFFVEPEFHFGLESVKKAIFNHLPAFRHLILIEIADLALTLPRYLSEAEAIPRGRPSKKEAAIRRKWSATGASEEGESDG